MNADRVDVELTVNGVKRRAEIDTRMLLVEALREGFGVTGPKIGCLTGDCGACTVKMDGAIVKSCLELAVAASGSEIVTIEGLSGDGPLSALQEAFWSEHAFQCGYCLSGMLFAADDLFTQIQRPSDDEIRAAIDGNLCRCTGYESIVTAIRVAAGATPS
jgi:aerobic-type carbon monoxide dehydrogenase small subunit (CoxS/CutS family)